MAHSTYTASKSPTKNGTSWTMSFRHPLRKDPRGKQGLKIRRGLGTGNEAEAQALVDEMNVLLSDSSWHSIVRRAEAGRKFSPVVVRAFYDAVESSNATSWDRRNQSMQLPGREQGYSRVMLVGTTGAGKTSLLRHLIGSSPKIDRFPSTSASRTTISDIEVIPCDEQNYRAVVTFFDEWTIRTNVHECVADACSALWDDLSDDRLADRLLTHRDLRFRLNYIIGSWKQTASSLADEDDGWSYEGENFSNEEPEFDEDNLPDASDVKSMQKVISGFLGRVRQLANETKSQLSSVLEVDIKTLTDEDKEAAQDMFEEFVQSLPDFDDLVNDILDEVQKRFQHIDTGTVTTAPSGWPQSWEFEVADRAVFLQSVRRYSSNYAQAFGTLLTPLVDGIRVQGPFIPSLLGRSPKIVLLDGEGIGHVGNASDGLSSRIRRRFDDVDVILLVDTGKSPMLEAPALVLRAIAASGHQRKCFIAFTHFDLVLRQQNLPTPDDARAHVMSALNQTLASLREVVGQPAVRSLERNLGGRCFMLGHLDKPLTSKSRSIASEIVSLIEACESATQEEAVPEARPIYDNIADLGTRAIQPAAVDFHHQWDAILGIKPVSDIPRAHWTQVKALNRRVVLNMNDREYKDLKPVASLAARLSEAVTKFLASPERWRAMNLSDGEAESMNPNDEEAEVALEEIQRKVFSRLDKFIETNLIEARQSEWEKAFNYSGTGSTFDRAMDIHTIYNKSAPIPGPGPYSTDFLRGVRKIVEEAIGDAGDEPDNETVS